MFVYIEFVLSLFVIMANDKYLNSVKVNNVELAKQLTEEKAKYAKVLNDLNRTNRELAAERQQNAELREELDALRLKDVKRRQFFTEKVVHSSKYLSDMLEYLETNKKATVMNERKESMQKMKNATVAPNRRRSSGQSYMTQIDEETTATIAANSSTIDGTQSPNTAAPMAMAAKSPVAGTSASFLAVSMNESSSHTIRKATKMVTSTPVAGLSVAMLSTSQMSNVSHDESTSRSIRKQTNMVMSVSAGGTSATNTSGEMSIDKVVTSNETITEATNISVIGASRSATSSAAAPMLSSTVTEAEHMEIDRPSADLFDETNLSLIFDPEPAATALPQPMKEVKKEPKSPKPKKTLPSSTAGPFAEKGADAVRKNSRKNASEAPKEHKITLKTVNELKKSEKKPKSKKESTSNTAESEDIATSTSSADEGVPRVRSSRKRINYAEEKLNTKMRRKN